MESDSRELSDKIMLFHCWNWSYVCRHY